MAELERTFFMVKPDGVQRGVIGNIISRFESRGLKLVAMKFIHIPRNMAEEHYKEHVGKPFFESLLQYITSGPVVAGVLEGADCVNVARSMMGKTNPIESPPGTIRGDFGLEVGRNIIHGSDSNESATREIGLFFSEDEIISYKKIDEDWLYE
jgi:nucleoside-diphosphate kinase